MLDIFYYNIIVSTYQVCGLYSQLGVVWMVVRNDCYPPHPSSIPTMTYPLHLVSIPT